MKLVITGASAGPVIVGDYFYVAARFRGSRAAATGRRRVVVQAKLGSRWTRIASETAVRGMVKIWGRAPNRLGRLVLRVVAPRAPQAKAGTGRALVSGNATLRVVRNPFPAKTLGAFRTHELVDDIAVDRAGTVYVAGDFPTFTSKSAIADPKAFHPRILRLRSDGTWAPVAGNGNEGSPVPGPALASPLGELTSLVVDSTGALYAYSSCHQNVAKPAAHCENYVVKVSGGQLTTYVGGGTSGSDVEDGVPSAVSLGGVAGLAVGPQDDLFIALANMVDPSRIMRVTPDGSSFSTFTTLPPCPSADVVGTIAGEDALASDGAGRLLLSGHCGQRTVLDVSVPGAAPRIAGVESSSGRFVPGPASHTVIPRGGNPYGFGFATDAPGNVFLPVKDGLEWVNPSGTASVHRLVEGKVTFSGWPDPQAITIGPNGEIYLLAAVDDPKSKAQCPAVAAARYDNDCVLVMRVGRP